MAAARSLYEDWQFRREAIGSDGSADGAILRVLDFLLHRYRDAPEGARPARFPAAGQLLLDRRSIQVHDHLGDGRFSCVKSERESSERISRILQRMAKAEIARDVKPPRGLLSSSELWELTGAMGGLYGRLLLMAVSAMILWAIAWSVLPFSVLLLLTVAAQPIIWVLLAICGETIDHSVQTRVMFHLKNGPLVPENLVRHLAKRLPAPWALELLAKCGNETIPGYCVERWIRNPKWRENLEPYILHAGRREAVAEALRPYLANLDPAVRLCASQLMARVGSLDDVGLLLDVSAIAARESNGSESEGMLQAATDLARQSPQAPDPDHEAQTPLP